tara:strand:- start:1245 stop:2558 length:1314 start_codon:yes stop_codon:yes gene_type:complete
MKNHKNYFSYLILLVSFLLLFYVTYKSELYHQGEKRDYYLHYYYLSIILIFFSFLSFYLNKRIKTYIIICLVSSITAFYLFEIYYNYLIYKYTLNATNLETQKRNSIKYKNLTGKEYDKRSRLEIYKDFKKNKKNVTLSVGSMLHSIDLEKVLTFSGVSGYKTIMCNESGYYATYESDRYGFNNPDNQWNENNVDFILIGDSFVQGGCVNRPNDIASNLRKLNLTGLNLGIGGNGPLTNFAILREYNIQSKNIIWFFYEGNDLINLEREIKNKYLMNYLKDQNFNQNLKSKQKLINELILTTINDNIKEKIDKINYYEFFSKIIKLYQLRQFIFNSPKPEFEQILKLTKDFTLKNNSNLYFVYLPDFYTVKTNLKKGHYYKVKNIVNKLDIPFIDIHDEVFKKQAEPLKVFPFQQNGHYNEAGYQMISEGIFRIILK